MSDTPETDAVASIEGNWDTKALRMTNHARKLERERNEARKLASALHEDQTKLIMERDEVREQLAIALETLRLIAEEGGQTEGRTIIPDGAWCAKQAQYTLDNPK
jgi:hypothetical protein